MAINFSIMVHRVIVPYFKHSPEFIRLISEPYSSYCIPDGKNFLPHPCDSVWWKSQSGESPWCFEKGYVIIWIFIDHSGTVKIITYLHFYCAWIDNHMLAGQYVAVLRYDETWTKPFGFRFICGIFFWHVRFRRWWFCLMVYLVLNFSGAVLGILAFAGSFVAETMVLGWYLYGQIRMPGPIFPDYSDNTWHPVKRNVRSTGFIPWLYAQLTYRMSPCK